LVGAAGRGKGSGVGTAPPQDPASRPANRAGRQRRPSRDSARRAAAPAPKGTQDRTQYPALMATAAPTGIIALMFTDIEDSTALWEQWGEVFRPALDHHNDLIADLIRRWDGYEVKRQGDSFMVAFQRATDAVQCAVDIQRALAEEGQERRDEGQPASADRPPTTDDDPAAAARPLATSHLLPFRGPSAQRAGPRALIRVRIGIHIGEPFLGYDAEGRVDYFGPMVNRASRTASAGHGGQILISSPMREIVEGALTGDIELLDLGRHRLRGLEQAEHLFEV